jgi:hypothetical protein
MTPASLALVRQGFSDQSERSLPAGLVALTSVGAHTDVWTVALLMVPVGLDGAVAVPALTAMLLDAVPAVRPVGPRPATSARTRSAGAAGPSGRDLPGTGHRASRSGGGHCAA